MTTTQNFYSADLLFWRRDKEPITKEMVYALIESFNCFPAAYVSAHVDNETTTEYVCISLETGADDDAYYQHECNVSTCFDHTQFMLEAVWKCPRKWEWQVEDQKIDGRDEIKWKIETLIEEIEPDEDWAYENFRDEKLLARFEADDRI